MTTVQEIIRQVMQSEREIDSDISMLISFNSDIDEAISFTNKTLAGSEKGYDQQLIQSLQRTKEQVTQTINQLKQTKTYLEKVRTI